MYVRNYIETDAFKKVLDKDTFVACSKDISDKKSITANNNFVGEFGVSKVNKALFHFITQLLMYSNRKINKGFYSYFKVKNTSIYFPSLRLKRKASVWFSNTICQSIVIRCLELIRPFSQPIRLVIFLLIIMIDFLKLTNIVVSLYNRILFNNNELNAILNKVKPDLILMPNGGLDPYANDIIFASNRNGKIKTMLLVDNWDNLCSKSKFPISPDYLCVWGIQTRLHAINFHNFDPSKIFLAGTPRFDVYYRYQKKDKNMLSKHKDLVDFPYILFAGCWPAFDEISVLEILNNLVNKHKSLLPKGCKILYRPHPWGENYDKLDYLISKKLENIEIDPQMSKKSRPDDYTKRTDFQPDLDYYPVLLDNSEFVICPLSSIIIEASIMNKKILALAHDDGVSLLNPSYMYNNSDYFDKLSNLETFSLLEDLSCLDKMFQNVTVSEKKVNKKSLGYYIVNDNDLYSDRISKIINKLPI